MQTTMIIGYRYLITFINEHSRMCFVYPMKARSQAFDRFKEFHAMDEKQIRNRLRTFKVDGAKVYKSNKFVRYKRGHDILLERSAPHAPQEMGSA